MHVSLLDEMDHSMATITPARVAMIPRPRLEELINSRPAITRALWWTQLVDEGILRAWIVSLGRRDSVARVSHLMCELYIRARNIGLTDGDHVKLPLTQAILGDALGLTPVHINRVLHRLKSEGVMHISSGMLTISDPSKLAIIAGFDDNYLHRRLRVSALRSIQAIAEMDDKVAAVP